ncbi:MAG TPA: CPBP family intramembrane glutamic endopeptidase [Anaerolineales bacterium]|nr:CPBP family intramembrane glutamic endopeptidase [Anaerolineales bacterium]
MDQGFMQPVPEPEPRVYSIPWSVTDTWIGVLLLSLLNVGLLIFALGDSRTEVVQSAALIFIQLAYLLPLLVVFAWRRVHWKHLGFGQFDWNTLGLGCGLLIASYIIIIFHNLILMALGIDTQGEAIFRFFDALESPWWFFFVGAVLAPIVEEVFFRGFVFQGFRQRYGWVNAMILSSVIFAAAHLDLVAFLPTFILGCLLAYMYQRTNSVWPGVILHFLINAFGLCAAYVATQVPGAIPT